MKKFHVLFFLFLHFLLNQNALSQTGKDGTRTIITFNTVVNTPLVLNTNYQWNLANTLRFDPNLANTANVTFKFTVLDNAGANDASYATVTIPINGEPVAEDQTNSFALSNLAGITLLDALNGTDDVSISTFRFSVLPSASQGVLYVNNIPATINTAFSWTNRNQIQFDPAIGNTANVTFSYIVKDNENAEDASAAVFTIPLISTDQDLDKVADIIDLDDDNDGIPDLLESNGFNPSADDDNDGIENYRDPSFPNGDYNSVTKVNNLFDKDRDGIINAFDLDSDGDGITDVVEQTPFGRVPSSNYSANTGRLTSPVGANGIPKSSTTITEGSLNDFDGDGLYNFLDLDSDNDGLRDYLEAQASPGNPVITPKGTDADKDGIDDNYDVTCGCSAPSGLALYPVNTDVDSFPDYLDQNSDEDAYGDAIEAYDNSNPAQVSGYSLTELKDLADQFRANALAAGNGPATAYYSNTNDSDNDSIPDWLEDDDEDGRLNYLEYGLSYYHDSDNDGWLDLFDSTTFGTEPIPNYAFRQSDILIPLPVGLIKFIARPEMHGVQLHWETASEEKNNYFVVERSSDGISFETIGQVKGVGTTQQQTAYSFPDKNPLNGTSYYRLKIVATDGNSRFSKIIAVKRESSISSLLRTFQNPTTGEFTLEFSAKSSEEVHIIITNVSGQVIYTQKRTATVGLNAFRLDITGVRSGTYQVQVRGRLLNLVQRLVKN
ncbi:T9SS type A sorting domain-containing protein [Adhaeribacter radiodurans]|uniref:T9SS type A sorting domain-containing protein n=1 Tax=Adhaeribacter radiodurans TaxID=2745197 RepID=A0A7L7L7I5_9BACT|nr:T9SS type A sorting domain-containing protein [Adhaeribacter radiodurans]QMU28714.1 T9SS type A sorting domain-containing protein [Adhaeribacter radiodurans]